MGVSMNPLKRLASCSCTQLQASCTGEPVRISMCHCLECQKRTGSAFGIQARFPKDNVTLTGTAKSFTRTGDSGGKITFFFCPDCGSTVYYEIEAIKDFVAIAIGNFADPQFPAPKFSVYESRRHPWTEMPSHTCEKYG